MTRIEMCYDIDVIYSCIGQYYNNLGLFVHLSPGVSEES